LLHHGRAATQGLAGQELLVFVAHQAILQMRQPPSAFRHENFTPSCRLENIQAAERAFLTRRRSVSRKLSPTRMS
ncbi:MAG: hypothetical protein EBT13_15640, partial [Rhodobacteraceae bacterium]|nr:hypothetical protein [Paracoccaceae bacterium]